MAYLWWSPVPIGGIVAECVQGVLSSIGAFELTEENFEDFCKYNDEHMLLLDGDNRTIPAIHSELRCLIGFRYTL